MGFKVENLHMRVNNLAFQYTYSSSAYVSLFYNVIQKHFPQDPSINNENNTCTHDIKVNTSKKLRYTLT